MSCGRVRLFVFAAILLLTSNAFAQAQRTFVSAGTGNDANDCSRTAPCRNFAKAIASTLTSGEVVVLDSGGYGPFTVSIPMSIIAPTGVYAGVTAFSGIGITVAANEVLLRGLTVNGLGGNTGILINTPGVTTFVEHCTVNGFTGSGLNASLDDGKVYIADSTFRNNGFAGVSFAGAFDGVASGVIVNSYSVGNVNGFSASTNTELTISHSVAAGNSGAGFISCCSNSPLKMANCTSADNGEGVRASGTGEVYIGYSLISGNGLGLFEFGSGTINSLGNNIVQGNVTNITGTITTFSGD